MNAPNPAAPSGTEIVDVATLQHWLQDGQEIAFIDVREEGIHGEAHPLLAVNAPFSRLEIELPNLVPRAATRVVLLRRGRRSVRWRRAGWRRSAIGAVHLLDGGVEAWTAAGHPLFASVNVPSEGVCRMRRACLPHAGHRGRRPRPADQVRRRRRRARQPHRRGIRALPRARRGQRAGAEIVHRFADLVPSPDTFAVVSCAGRTRKKGIIGAQALINAGVPNRIAALSGGTQGWRLAGARSGA